MTRFPTSGALLLLIALLVTPVSAQVIMGGSPLGIPGSGTVTSIATASPITGGTITSSGTIHCATCVTSAGMTTGVIPMASGANALADSIISQASTVATVTGSLGVTTANTHTGVLYVDGSGHVAAGGDGSGALQFSYVPGAGAANGSIDFAVAKAITTPDDGDDQQVALFATAYIDHLDSAAHPHQYYGAVLEADHIGTGLAATLAGSVSAASTKNGDVTSLRASYHQAQAIGSGNVTETASVFSAMPVNSGSGTITTASGLLIANGSLLNPSTGAITNMYGVKINAQTGPTVTNQYGLWIDDVALGGTIKQAIHTGAGDVVLGTLTTTGAATGKTVVCADSNGKLYRSSAGNSCAN